MEKRQDFKKKFRGTCTAKLNLKIGSQIGFCQHHADLQAQLKRNIQQKNLKFLLKTVFTQATRETSKQIWPGIFTRVSGIFTRVSNSWALGTNQPQHQLPTPTHRNLRNNACVNRFSNPMFWMKKKNKNTLNKIPSQSSLYYRQLQCFSTIVYNYVFHFTKDVSKFTSS